MTGLALSIIRPIAPVPFVLQVFVRQHEESARSSVRDSESCAVARLCAACLQRLRVCPEQMARGHSGGLTGSVGYFGL
jgi:hypothetical protein